MAGVDKVTLLTEPKIAYEAFVAVSARTMSRAVSDFSTTKESGKHCEDSQLKTNLAGS
jgi:hypothetical protein